MTSEWFRAGSTSECTTCSGCALTVSNRAGWEAIQPSMRADASAVPAWDPSLAPEALLRAVREAGGGVAALAALRRGLRSGELHLVTQQCASLSDMG